ncbi:MAG: glycosyltransferase [Rhodospirillales bacterium]|nr:glycosyltransferase [Rhodospirillales bacterium]
MKRYPRLTETFILNEIRAMERLGADLHIFSLLQPEPPPHHPMVAEVRARVSSPPAQTASKIAAFLGAHAAQAARAPLRYAAALACAVWWSAQADRPLSVWKQFARGGFIAHACRREGIRHIHAHFANAPAAAARFAAIMSGIPYSFTAHAKDLYLTPRRVIWRRARAARFVATCTEYNAEYLRELLGDQAGKVQRIYHGIDLALFAARAAPEPAPVPFILSVGRLVEKKGHDDLIAAFAALRDRGIAFRAEIVGAGPLRDDLAADIAARGLADRVRLRGPMTHAALIDLYRTADLFALAPRIAEDGDRDGIPNVLAEAMAIGVPVLATAISGIPELVRDGETGRLVAPRDPAALAEAMAALLADPDAARALAATGRALLERDFDLWVTTRRLRALMAPDACCDGAHAAAPRRALRAEAVAGPQAGR